jgi:hypothetical protein
MPLLDRPTGSGLSLQRRRPLPSGDLTLGITRRPEPLMYMRIVVSAVGCMPLLDGVFRKNAVLQIYGIVSYTTTLSPEEYLRFKDCPSSEIYGIAAYDINCELPSSQTTSN